MRRPALLFALALLLTRGVARAEPPREERGAEHAAAWWHTQRAYPAIDIPAGAYARGRERLRALHQKPAPPPGPGGSPWTFIGPAPIDTTHGSLETPNMGPSSGRVTAVVIDPVDSSTLYAGYALGGVWKTIDGGASWAPLMDLEPTLAVGAIAVDPMAPATLYVGTGEPAPYIGYSGQGVFKSTDGGKTFQKLGDTTFDGLAISRLYIDDAAGHLYASALFGALGRGQICNEDVDAKGQGLYRSADGGKTWALLQAGQITDLEVDTSVMPRRLFISDYATGALRSDDGGKTWAAPAGLPTAQSTPKARRIELSLSPTNPSVVYAGFSLGSTAVIYLSQDGGKSFSPMAGAPDYCGAQCYYDNSVLVDPTDENTLYVGGSLCGVWKTQDATAPTPTWVNVSLPGNDCAGGNNWYNGYVHPDVHDLAIDPKTPSTLFASTDGGVARSADGGATWSQLNAGVGTLQIYALCVDPKDPLKIYAGSQDNGSFMRTSASLTWQGLVSGDGGPCAVDPQNPKHVLVSSDGASVAHTSNGFATTAGFVFEPDDPSCAPTDPGCGDRASFIAPLVGDPSTPGTFYVGTYRLWKTTDGGATSAGWTAVSDDLTGGQMSLSCPNAAAFPEFDDVINAIAVAPSSPSTLYTGSQAGVLSATFDGGATWKRVDKAPLPGRWVSSIAVDPRDARTVFVAFSGFDEATPGAPGHVFRSTDGGDTWAARDTGANVPIDTLIAHPVASDLLYAGTDSGVLVTTDGGETWLPLDDGLPRAPVYALAYQRAGGALIAGTFGRSAWSYAFGAGSLQAKPTELTFTFQQGGAAPAPQAVQVSNSDVYGSIVGFTVTSGAPWLTVDVTSGDAAGARPIAVNATADPGKSEPGTLETTLTVTPTSGGAPITIPVHLTITAKPSEEKGGCGCRAVSTQNALGASALMAGVGLWMARRRGRRGARS